MIKALAETGWDKQKKTLMATYKSVMRRALGYSLLLLSTHSLVPCLLGESDHPTFGSPASLSLHLASIYITPVGSVHKSTGDSVVRMFAVMYGRRLFSSVFAITERRDMDLYEVPLSVFVEFWDRDYVSQVPCVRYYVFVKSSFKHARESKCLAVFVNCLVKQFGICLGVFVTLLLNGMELLSVVGEDLLDRPCMVFHIMCVLCLWSQ